MNYTFSRFKPELIPHINRLLDIYKHVYPKVTAPPAESYLAPWTEGGKNVMCAFDENGELCGFAPLVLSDVPDKPYTFWTAIRFDPEFPSDIELQDALLDRLKERAWEILRTLPERENRLAFQYHRSEIENIKFVVSKGGIYAESEFLMKRDLSRELPSLPLPAGIEIRHSKMTNEDEQKAYLAVRNKAFVEGRPHQLSNSAVSLEDWQVLLHHVYQPKGCVILACWQQQIIGSIIVYPDENNTGITDDVFVAEEWRRKGIGSYLIREGLEYFTTTGLEKAQLGVNSANKRALGLYEKQGYVLTDESPFYVINLD